MRERGRYVVLLMYIALGVAWISTRSVDDARTVHGLPTQVARAHTLRDTTQHVGSHLSRDLSLMELQHALDPFGIRTVASLTRPELIARFSVDTDLGFASNDRWVSDCIIDHWTARTACDLRDIKPFNPDWLGSGIYSTPDDCDPHAFGPRFRPESPVLGLWPSMYDPRPSRSNLQWMLCDRTHSPTVSLVGWDAYTGQKTVLRTHELRPLRSRQRRQRR